VQPAGSRAPPEPAVPHAARAPDRGPVAARRPAPAEMPSARGVTVAWVVGYQAKGFIHRTARTPRMETRATRPRRYHWPMPTGSPRRFTAQTSPRLL
jgi:hypothetical protein